MIRETIERFTINYSPDLECATVTIQGILLPEVVHSEDDPDAVEKCRQWITSQLNGGRNDAR